MKISSQHALYPITPAATPVTQPRSTSALPEGHQPTPEKPEEDSRARAFSSARQALSAYGVQERQRAESIRESFAYAEQPQHLAVRKAISEYQDTALNEQRAELQSLGIDVFA